MAASKPKNVCYPATVLFVVDPSLFGVNKKQSPFSVIDRHDFVEWTLSALFIFILGLLGENVWLQYFKYENEFF